MTPKKTLPLRRTLILDPIHPRDYRELTIIHCCEQCSHFAPGTQTCTIGYDAFNHTAAKQKENYERLGRVAFCRFCEID
jgi:hypothetical protein